MLRARDSFFNKKVDKVDFAILSAMPDELESLVEALNNVASPITLKINQLDFKVYEYKDSRILIGYTGIGTTFAASIVTLVHNFLSPEYILFCGTAGGINTELHIRDVVVVEQAFEAEIQDLFTSIKGTPFESCLHHPVKNSIFPAVYSADPELLKIVNEIVTDIRPRVHIGTVVSSNMFPAPKELFSRIKNQNPFSIDMETSAVYQAAWLLNAKVIAIRGISNILNHDGTDENISESDVKGSSRAAAMLVLKILHKLIDNKCLNSSSMKLKDVSIDDDAKKLITQLNLQSHPEGGYFAAFYKSTDTVQAEKRYNGEKRSAGTSIYYMLNNSDFSAWHKLESDEIWHHYKGSPVNIHVIDEFGNLNTYLLGDPTEIQLASFQVCIKAGNWFAAENINKETYSLVGCTVSPGFEYCDFKLADRDALLRMFPQHATVVKKFTRVNLQGE